MKTKTGLWVLENGVYKRRRTVWERIFPLLVLVWLAAFFLGFQYKVIGLLVVSVAALLAAAAFYFPCARIIARYWDSDQW